MAVFGAAVTTITSGAFTAGMAAPISDGSARNEALVTEFVKGGLLQPAASSGAGTDLVVRAATAATGAGGNVVLIGGLHTTSGADGLIVVRQNGGVAGTDELQISHNGTSALIESKDGTVSIKSSAVASPITIVSRDKTYNFGDGASGAFECPNPIYGTGGLRAGSTDTVGFSSNSSPSAAAADIAIKRSAATVLGLTNGSTAGGTIASKPLAATFGSSQNNYNPGVGYFLNLTASSAATSITGFSVGQVDGQIMIIRNVGSNAFTISNQSGSSTAANRVLFATGADAVVAVNGNIRLRYDSTAALWFDF